MVDDTEARFSCSSGCVTLLFSVCPTMETNVQACFMITMVKTMRFNSTVGYLQAFAWGKKSWVGVAPLSLALLTVWNIPHQRIGPSSTGQLSVLFFLQLFFLSFFWGKLFNEKGIHIYGYFVDQQEYLISFILGYDSHIRLPVVSQISTFF